MPGLRYKLNKRRGRPQAIPHLKGDHETPTVWGKLLQKRGRVHADFPQLTRREVRAIEEHQAQMDRIYVERLKIYERDRAIYTLNALSDLQPTLRVAFINAKGAAATTTTTAHAVSVFADNTRTTAYATDFNPASGTLGSRLGRDYDETIGLRQLADDADELAAFRDFIPKARPTRYGVRVISADSIIEKGKKIHGVDAKKILAVVNQNSEYHFVDTANDIIDTVTLAVIEDVDVLVFTANVAVHDSLRQLAISMGTLRQQGFADKVNHSVVVISNIPEGAELADFWRYLNYHNISDVQTESLEHFFKGQFLGIPTDPIIARDTEVDLEALAWDTYQAYLELDIAIFEMAPEFWDKPIAAEVEYNRSSRPEPQDFEGFEFFEPVTQ